MRTEIPKQYLRLRGRTVLELTLEKLHGLECLSGIVVALHGEDSWWKTLDTRSLGDPVTVAGGAERSHSVLNGLLYLKDHADGNDWILVHDAVRPCLSRGDVEKLMTAVVDDPVGGILAVPVRETVKAGGEDGVVQGTLDRRNLWLAATPQLFRFGVLLEALENALRSGAPVTDEAAAVELLGRPVRLVEGRPDNIKITRPEDLDLAEKLL